MRGGGVERLEVPQWSLSRHQACTATPPEQLCITDCIGTGLRNGGESGGEKNGGGNFHSDLRRPRLQAGCRG